MNIWIPPSGGISEENRADFMYSPRQSQQITDTGTEEPQMRFTRILIFWRDATNLTLSLHPAMRCIRWTITRFWNITLRNALTLPLYALHVRILPRLSVSVSFVWMRIAGLKNLRRNQWFPHIILFLQAFMWSEEDSWSNWLRRLHRKVEMTS